MPNYPGCLETFTETRKKCTDLRDDGYEECGNWSHDCVSWAEDCVSWAKECVVKWIPIIGPLICKVFEWICKAFGLICKAFEWICKGVVWISHMVCHAFNVIVTVTCLLWETVSLVLAIPGIIIKLIFSIPIIGGLIKEIVNLGTGVGLGIIGFVGEGFFCGLLRICLPKKLRLCVIITHDGSGPITTEAALQPILDRAKRIYRDEADVTIYADFDTGPASPQVEPSCGAAAWGQDLWLTGSQYENAESLHCREYAAASIVGIGSPIYAFAVRDIEGSSNGCSLGPLTNYVVFEVGDVCSGNTHLAHEMGHACNLLRHDDDDATNLMYPDCVEPGRDQLSAFQKSIIRGSKYVTYF